MSNNNDRNGALKKSQRESTQQKTKGPTQNGHPNIQNGRQLSPSNGKNESSDEPQQPTNIWEMSYEDAEAQFEKQLDDIRQQELAQGTSPDKIDQILAEARQQFNNFQQQIQLLQNQNQTQLAAQNPLLSQMQVSNQLNGEGGVDNMMNGAYFNGDMKVEDSEDNEENEERQREQLHQTNMLLNQNPLLGLAGQADMSQVQSMMQGQQWAMLLQQMSQNQQNHEELMEKQRLAQEQSRKRQMGNQLRLFLKKLFSQVTQRQKKALDKLSKVYLDSVYKDQKKLFKDDKKGKTDKNDQNQVNEEDLQADPQKYLNEFENTLKKHPDLGENFQRFKCHVFEDVEIEQVFVNFFILNPHIHNQYMALLKNYHVHEERQDMESQEEAGVLIFNIIMPCAHKYDPRLLQLIPQSTLNQFEITYEEDEFHIASWRYAGGEEGSESEDSSSADQSSSGSNQSGGSGSQNTDRQISANDIKPLGSISQPNQSEQDFGENHSVISGDDNSQFTDRIPPSVIDHANRKNGIRDPRALIPPNIHLVGRNKSLLNHFNATFPGNTAKNINKNEIRPLDNLFKNLKDEKDWTIFCKLLFLYFDGVTSIKETIELFDEKFQNKLRQDTKEEIMKLLPTRDQSRRQQSNLLKAWNDTDNQNFFKIPNSSYFRINECFPLPSCFMRQTDPVYYKNLNDRYLQLATGSENQKFRNQNEDAIYKTEDKMYLLDSQIDTVEKSQKIVQKECRYFNQLSEEDQANYKFPISKLSPMRWYWDQKFRRSINDQYLKDGKILKLKELKAFEHTLKEKLEFLQNQKKMTQAENKDCLRKNFAKSLDHKSFQFRDFMRKYLAKNNHISSIKKITEENAQKKRHLLIELNKLCGSGEQSMTSDYMFTNTFGREFVQKFDENRSKLLESTPDYPIDMKFMTQISHKTVNENQNKCPQSRFLMNDELAFEITLKLVVQSVKCYCNNQTKPFFQDQQKLMNSLKFIVEKFLMFSNFEKVAESSEKMKTLDGRKVDILLNSASYYQMKYDGKLENMQEVFPIEGFQDEIWALNKDNHLQINDLQSTEIQQQNPQIADNSVNPEGKGESELEDIILEKAPKSQISMSQQNKDSDSEPEEFEQSIEEFSEPSRVSSVRPDAKIPYKKLKLLNNHEINQLDLDLVQKEIQDAQFVPQYVQKEGVETEKQYRLLYGPTNIYMFLTFFYSVYERILKAQELIAFKVEQDFKDDFSKLQWSQKFSQNKQQLIDERFQYLVKAILTIMYQSNVLDTTKYEDLARELLGKEAYLLFQADKLVNHCVKHLAHLQSDPSYKISKKLFKQFEKMTTKNESTYISNFYKAANECSQATQLSTQAGNRAGGGNPATGAAAVNKDPLINLQSFRLMYSPVSKILTVHFVVLNPFNLQENKALKDRNTVQMYPFKNTNGNINQDEYLDSFLPLTRGVETDFYEQDREQSDDVEIIDEPQEIQINKAQPHTQPVFLERNLRKMKQLRKEHEQKQAVENKNELKFNVIPLIRQIAFESNTEDVLRFNRPQKQDRLVGTKRVKQDLKLTIQASNSIEKRRKEIDIDTNYNGPLCVDENIDNE